MVYLEHAALMEKLGWENAFFSMHHPKNLDSPWSKYFVNEIAVSHASSLASKISMATKVVYSYEAQRKLQRLLEDFPADVAHLHCIYHLLSPSILSTLNKADIPVVMTAHDLKLACPAYKMLTHDGICERCKDGSLLNVIKHRCIHDSLGSSTIVSIESLLHHQLNTYKRYLNKVVAPSRFYIEKFVEWGWPREKFVHIPNYVDASRFTPNFSPGDYFLYFGRLAPEKGVATLLRAVKKSGVKLKIAGTGPEERALNMLQAELQGDVEFLGYLSGKSLHSLICGARAVVLPSEWYENAPMSILESYAFGKPVIGASIGGIPEMICDGMTGWTFESSNVDELASILSYVSSLDAKSLEFMGRCVRDYVESRFNVEMYRNSVVELYSDLRC